MEIRAATLKDAPFISALLCELTGRFIAHELSEEAAGRLLESMDEAAIRGYMASGYCYHVAEENGEVIGVAAVKDNSHLFHLFVAEIFQRKGLARRLWDVAREACLRAGNPGVFTVNSSRYAVGVYEKLGFVRQSAAVDVSGVICIPMKLELAARRFGSEETRGQPTMFSGKASRPESHKRQTRPRRTETIVPPGFPERGTAGID